MPELISILMALPVIALLRRADKISAARARWAAIAARTQWEREKQEREAAEMLASLKQVLTV